MAPVRLFELNEYERIEQRPLCHQCDGGRTRAAALNLDDSSTTRLLDKCAADNFTSDVRSIWASIWTWSTGDVHDRTAAACRLLSLHLRGQRSAP